MQDAMSLTRTLKLDATRQRRTQLYASDRARLEDAVAACDPPGDVRAALRAFGLRLDDALLDRFVRQAFNCGADAWLARCAAVGNDSEAGGAGIDNEVDAEDAGEKGEAGAPPTPPAVFGPEQLLEEVVELATCAFAHPIQYGEDIRLSAARGEDARVEELLRRGCNPMAPDGMGWTTLHHAAQWGRVSTIKLIKQHWPDVDVNARDRCGWTPFMNSVAGSHKDACMELKRMGATPSNATNYGRNALHVASMKGLTEMVRMLLGMDKSLMRGKDKAGWTPLFCAVQHDELPCVRLLVAAGANIEAVDGIKKTADVYGDEAAHATMTGTALASPRSPRPGDEEEGDSKDGKK